MISFPPSTSHTVIFPESPHPYSILTNSTHQTVCTMSSDTWNNGDLESEDDPTSRHDEPAAATKKSESPTHVATPVVNGERSKLDTTMDMNPGTRAFNSNSRIGYFSSLPLEILELIINNVR